MEPKGDAFHEEMIIVCEGFKTIYTSQVINCQNSEENK
jgi:hypothetical protein